MHKEPTEAVDVEAIRTDPVNLLETVAGIKRYPYQRDMVEWMMSLPKGHRFVFYPARHPRFAFRPPTVGEEGSTRLSSG